MAIRQTGKKLDARERARLARTRVDRVRAEHDSKIEATLADYFTTSDDRDNRIVQLAAIENTIGLSVQNLLDLGENASQVADLLDVNPKKVKRLRGLATTPIAAEAESPVAVVDA